MSYVLHNKAESSQPRGQDSHSVLKRAGRGRSSPKESHFAHAHGQPCLDSSFKRAPGQALPWHSVMQAALPKPPASPVDLSKGEGNGGRSLRLSSTLESGQASS